MNGKENTIKAIQGLLGMEQDGIFGPKCRLALEGLIEASRRPVETPGTVHSGIASSFADPADVRSFKRCKERGGSDQDCFRVGDNGIGCFGDDVSEGTGPSCALPPDDMIEKFGEIGNAKHAKVTVTANDQTIICTLKDRMPWKRNITNKAIIDLNPDAVALIGLKPPIMVPAEWSWASV